MADCKWMQDEICVNADCPMRADYCPVVDYPGVCRYEERDAVPVVRCFDCIHRIYKDMGEEIGAIGGCELWGRAMPGDNYCSFGERKDGDAAVPG